MVKRLNNKRRQTCELFDIDISHATTIKEDYYVIRYDGKEFHAKVIDTRRWHKDYPETTKIEVTQTPSQSDRKKVHDIVIENITHYYKKG